MIKVQKILSTLLNAVAFMLSNISIAISQDSYIKRPSLEQKDVKTYLDSVLLEIQSKKENNKSIKRALDR
jgi:hypothetical protein